MTLQDKPVANPLVVLRKEFDDWAVLFDPDTGHAYGLNPVSVLIWQFLDGRHTVEDIVREVQAACEDVPEAAAEHVQAFIADLLKNGLAGYDYQPK